MIGMPETLRVAAVQVESHTGAVKNNLSRAETWVGTAARGGAKLVVCPELLAAGYVYDEAIWSSAEARSGPTEEWLGRLASAYGIYLGASYLEAEGDDFYNTFALAGPKGAVVGRVRKESLPGFEGSYFRSSNGPKFIDTEIGRMAIGICQDNHSARFFRRVMRDDVDLILMPHSAPCPRAGAEMMRESLRAIAPFYARAFGVPVVLSNKAHTPSCTPIPFVPALRLDFSFAGLSSVCDADGRVVDRLAEKEGIAMGDVMLDPAKKRRPEPPKDAYWSLPPPGYPRLTAAAYEVMEALGKRAYARNPRRPQAAQRAGAVR
jgi:N-carbamoylputrescine amidase